MRQIFNLLSNIAVILCCIACEKSERKSDDIAGEWEDIVVNMTSASIPGSGGSVTFKSENYPIWWIAQVNARHGDMETIYRSPKDLVQSDWFVVTCSEETAELTVQINKNDTVEERKITIEMTAGDICTTVWVSQNCY